MNGAVLAEREADAHQALVAGMSFPTGERTALMRALDEQPQLVEALTQHDGGLLRNISVSLPG